MQLSDAEWKVMGAVWERSPASVRDVLEALEEETGWAYSTVKTLLNRLAEKGALSVRKRANASLFVPVVSPGQARRTALRSLVDRAFGGAFGTLVHHLVADQKLSAADRDELRRLLEEELAGSPSRSEGDEGKR